MGTDITSDQEYEHMQEAIANASSLFDNYEKKILDQKNLLKISGIVNSTLSMTEMNEALLFSCQGTILVTNISIFLIESVITNAFIHRSSVGLNDDPPPIRLEETDPLLARLSGREVAEPIVELRIAGPEAGEVRGRRFEVVDVAAVLRVGLVGHEVPEHREAERRLARRDRAQQPVLGEVADVAEVPVLHQPALEVAASYSQAK